MTDSSEIRVRREPPAFRRAVVARTALRSPRLMAVTLEGEDLVGFDIGAPAASVRLLVPPDRHEVVLPVWDGNLFRYADGERATMRTLTPRRNDPTAGTLDVEVVLHGTGPLATWAGSVRPGDPTAVSGPARGYEIDTDAEHFLLAGDESAIPALSQLLEALPAAARVDVVVEVAQPDGRVELPAHPGSSVTWVDGLEDGPPGSAMFDAVSTLSGAVGPRSRVWAAGEAASVQRIRKHLFDELALARSQAVVRGYWKHGRGETG